MTILDVDVAEVGTVDRPAARSPGAKGALRNLLPPRQLASL
jgi:hypothetical protein